MQDATVLLPGQCPGEVGDALAGLDRLVSNGFGLVQRVTRISPDTSDIAVYAAAMGELEHLQPNVRSTMGRTTGVELSGGGGNLNPRLARAISVAEALERYSSCSLPRDLRWATARELRDTAMDLTTFPACSEAELAHPACPVRRVDLDSPIRWTTGWSLTHARPVEVPAVAAWLHIAPVTAGERFTTPISTGCATHSDLHQAVLNGLCEVIERDAIALTWLQRLPLPELDLDDAGEELRRALADGRRRGITTRFFDATSELGVPTLYSVDTADRDDRVRHVVMAATDTDPERAALKMLRETASSRIALATADAPPADTDGFHSVFHGATYMGHPDRGGAFDFLLRPDAPRRPLSRLPRIQAGEARATLTLLTDRLATHGMDVVVVEMTTAEAASVGFRVVKVIVPQLMPLSFTHLARYLGHPRLYEGPRAMGYPAGTEADVNPWPQPFA